MARQSGKMFSTEDRDNDKSSVNCAEEFKGAWLHNDCADSNLNGFYHTENPTVERTGIFWKRWKERYHSLKATTMKIKRV